MGDLRLVLAALALERVVAQIGHGDDSAEVANVDAVGIGNFKETLAQELSRSVGDLTISFHLSESETAVAGTTFHGLADEDLDRTSGSRVDLVVHHVLETLVVGRAEKDLSAELATSVAVVEHFVASQVIAVLLQEVRDLLDVDGVVERSGVADFALVGRHFALKAFDQVTNCHTRRNGVRVDDDVGSQALASERHILLAVLNSARTLLTVTGGEFVANLRDADRADANLAKLVALGVQRQHHLVHNARLRVTQESGRVSFRELFSGALQVVVVLRKSDRFANNHVIARHTKSRCNDAVVV